MSLEAEILSIIEAEGGDRLQQVVDRFRLGEPVEQIIPLLDSANAEVASIGAWILGEIELERYQRDDILFRLRGLIAHGDSAVRFSAFGALFPALRVDNPEDRKIVDILLNDPNEGVRIQAKSAKKRLGLNQ